MPSSGRSAVCVASIVAPLGSPTVYLEVTGRLSTQGVSCPIKCLEHPVSGMPLAARVGTSDKRLQAKRFVLFL